jgi:hypothetical protein
VGSVMKCLLLSGKILETIGAFFIAYVGVRAAVLEVLVGRHLRAADEVSDGDVKKLGDSLKEILEHRRRQFGFYEAILVGAGTLFVFFGCGLYLVGLLMEPR